MAAPSTDPAAEREIAAAFGDRFRLLARMAATAGGFACVAHDTVLERDVVLELVARDAPVQGGRALRAARALAGATGHPNVVQLCDIGSGPGYLVLVREHGHGDAR